MAPQVNHQAVDYFQNLPRYALPALQVAWDRASGKNFGTRFIFNGFVKDLNEVGVASPSAPLMTQWIAGVQRGEIERPATLVERAISPNDHLTEVIAKQIVPSVELPEVKEEEQFIPLRPSDFAPEATHSIRRPLYLATDLTDQQSALADSLRAIGRQLVADVCQTLQQDLQLTAEKLVISQLRLLASEMERDAA